MTTPLWCLLIATFLPFVWVFAGHAFRYRQFDNIDNNHPRLQQAQLTGHAANAAMLFIATSIAHGCLYLAELSSLRSLTWMVGAGAVIWLFVLGAHGH